jgi:hypothetical protein
MLLQMTKLVDAKFKLLVPAGTANLIEITKAAQACLGKTDQ